MARVLVVDDSEDLQEALEMVLTCEGFEVVSALNGAQGLRVTSELRPDVILLDMMMPEMDGLEFLARLSTLPERPPVVAQSGFPDFRAEALRRGAHAFLVKPLSSEVLVRALRAALERSPIGQSVLAENAAEVELVRHAALEKTTGAVSRIGESGTVAVRDNLRRITRWIRTYFGFGTSLVTILRGGHCCVEAVHGGMAAQFDEGARYPREDFFCDDVMSAGSTLLLTDPIHHPCEHFAHHKALAFGVQFYAGVPLTAPSRAVLGTLCIVDTCPREFLTEDMLVLEALGLGAARGLETGEWPLDEDGVLCREYWEVFVDVAATRAAREGGAAIALSLQRRQHGALGSPATGCAAVTIDGGLGFIWSGKADGWTPPDAMTPEPIERVELLGVCDRDAARARLIALHT